MVKKVTTVVVLTAAALCLVLVTFNNPRTFMILPCFFLILFVFFGRRKKADPVKNELQKSLKEIKTLMKGRRF